MKDQMIQRVKGIFVNPRAGLFLTFQLNPQELGFDTSPSYEEEQIPGWHTSLVHWTGTAPEKITFELFFDSREQTAGANFPIPGIRSGTLGQKAILESFLRPTNIDYFRLRQEVTEFSDLFSNSRFFSPPDVYFIYGIRWFRCKLQSSPITETGHTKSLMPVQMRANVGLTVLDDGFFHKYSELQRKTLAVSESVAGAIELPFNFFG